MAGEFQILLATDLVNRGLGKCLPPCLHIPSITEWVVEDIHLSPPHILPTQTRLLAERRRFLLQSASEKALSRQFSVLYQFEFLKAYLTTKWREGQLDGPQ